METLVANIIYFEEITELKPLTEIGIKYVKRHGENMTAIYELNYSEVDKLGYAFLDKIVDEKVLGKITYINSIFSNKF